MNSSLYRPLLLCLIFTLAAPAQTALTGGLRGTVLDRSRAAVPDAVVTLRSETLAVTHQARTNSSGVFLFLGLAPAPDYQVSVLADGLEPWTQTGVKVASGDTESLTALLEPSSRRESVTVSAEAELLNGSTPEVSRTLGGRQLTQLPTNGRVLNRFALLDPRIRNTAGQGSDGSNLSRLSINGALFRDTHYKLDGNANFDAFFNNAPLQRLSVSAVQEFRVLTNQYSAEHGGTSAGMVLTTTKSGTDEFHGEAFFLGRPSGIQARPPLSNLRIPNQLLQYGASLGGPVVRGRTHFFANYEGTRQDRGSFISSPRPDFLIGEFRDTLALVRLDHRFRDTHWASLRVNGQRESNTNANDRVGGLFQPSYASTGLGQSVGVQASDTTLWGRLVNELRASYVNAVPSQSLPAVSTVSVVRPGYSTEGNSVYSFLRMEVYQLSDQASFQAGSHALQFGGEFVRRKAGERAFTEFGTYTFAAGPPRPGEQPLQYSQRFGAVNARYGQTQWGGFLQDNWRLHPRLTLSLGLRYEWQSLTDDANNLGPRVGFAWDVAGDSRTVVRGGAGLFYDQPYFHGFTQKFVTNGPFAPTLTYVLPFGAPGFPAFPQTLAAIPTGTSLPRRNIDIRGDRILNPYTSQFTFGVQRKLGEHWVASADVMHRTTVKMLQTFDINRASAFPRTAPGQMRSVADADATRPFSTYLGIPVRQVMLMGNGGSSVYDGLTLGLARRFARGIELSANYTYASSLNNQTTDNPASAPNEFSDVGRAERGRTDYHQRHRFVGYGTLQLPWRSQLSFVGTLASGLPVNPITGMDNNGDTTLFDRPAGFGRNSFNGTPQRSLDLSYAKLVPLRERVRLELRADAYNVTNHSNYYRFNNVYGNGPAPRAEFRQPLGGIANVDPGRQFTLALRLLF